MIRITRPSESHAVARGYKIFIDGTHWGNIKNGETKEFEIEIGNGSHFVYATIDWCRSKELLVEVNDSPVDLEVGARLTVRKSLIPGMFFLYMIIKRNDYLWIRKKMDRCP